MSTEEAQTLEQQRQRRNRINRIKTGIIVTLASWMIISLLALIILSIQMVRISGKVERLSNAQMNMGNEPVASEMEESDSEEQQEVSETQSKYDNVVTGIDSPDNIATDGDEHKVYLTFEGSPNLNTEKILDILKEYNVKATFFVAGDESDEMKAVYKRIVDEGHTLGMNSYSNQYSTIYASADAFEKDFDQISKYLKDVTGKDSLYYRFPGGSGNEISNVNMAELVHILNQKNITYYDWNVSAGDAASDYSADDVVKNVTTGVLHYKTSVVLLHDGENKSATVEALGPLIEALQEMDAEILPIDENTNVIQYIKADSVE